jgi:hypothetical protein
MPMAADPTSTDIPIACSLTTPKLRAREQIVQREFVAGVQETRELADGYALRFPGDALWLATLAELIRFERECCPFFTFELHCEPQHGPLWLHMRGPEGAKEFVATLLALPSAHADTTTSHDE